MLLFLFRPGLPDRHVEMAGKKTYNNCEAQ